jgi:hypothetical protein
MNVSIDHPTDKVNFSRVWVGDLTLVFSYTTIIAFQYGWGADAWVVRENEWSNTTGKHLNWVNEDKSIRVDGEEFKRRLGNVLVATSLKQAE